MSITQEKSAQAKEFMTAIEAILYVVEDIADKIPEGDYLKLMDNLKKVYGFKPAEGVSVMSMVVERVRQNPIVLQHDRQTRMKIKVKQEIKDDATKLKKGWNICENCDTIVLDLKEHQASKKCRDGACAKRLVKTTGTTENAKLKKGITLLKAIRVRED